MNEQAVVNEHAGLVRRIAGRYANRTPPNIEYDDLVSEAMIGLLQAIRRFDPSRGASLKTYAGYRIRGAVQDYLRNAVRSPDTTHDLNGDDMVDGQTPADDYLVAALGAAMERLTWREHYVLHAHYFEGWTLKEIGDALGVGAPRICQISHEAINKLRGDLE